MTRAGLPTTTTSAGTSLVTTAPAPTADHAPAADAHAWQHDRAAADPHVIADRDRPAHLDLAPLERVDRVRRGVQLHVGREEDVVPDADLGNVQHAAPRVGVEVPPHVDVRAHVACEHPAGRGAARGGW